MIDDIRLVDSIARAAEAVDAVRAGKHGSESEEGEDEDEDEEVSVDGCALAASKWGAGCRRFRRKAKLTQTILSL